MAKIVQTRRGSVEQHIGFDGQQGEVTFDLTANTLRVHDGSTFPADQPSGYPLARADLSNVFNAVGIQQLNLPEGTPGQFLTTDGAGTISFASINTSDDGTFDLGGDLSGTINTAEINANTISGIELDIAVPPTDGHLLTIDSTGVLGFIMPQTEFILAGDVNGPLGNNFLATNTVDTNNLIDLSVTSPKLADGAVTASKLAANAVSISSLDVPDGNAGQILSTDGNGELLFINNTTTVAGSSSFTEDIFQGDGTTIEFTVSVDIPSVVTVLVYIDGVSQPTTTYSAPTPRTLRFQTNGVSTPPLSGSTIRVVHLGIIDTGNASVGGDLTGTIANAQIIPNAVGIPELDVSDGNAGEFLRTNGAGLLEFAAAAGGSSGGGGLTGMQVFDTPGAFTWTKPSDVKSILYFVTAGGGGTSNSGGSNVGSGGGGGGSTAMGFFDVSNINSETGTVGAGGTVGSGVGNAGTGGSSTFGSSITAIGGQGSGVNNQSAVGGTSTGGQVNMPGSIGQANDTSLSNYSPGGGVSFFAGIGSGGKGALPPSGNGNAGSDGIVVILEFGGPEETTGSGGGASTSSIRGSLASYTSGGETINGGGGNVATKEKYTYASNSNQLSVGELREPGIFTSCQSATHGYSGNYGTDNSGNVSKFPFANDSVNAGAVADMNQDHTNGTTAHTSETHGYWAGGFPPSDGGSGRRISKFLFASESTTSSHGSLQTAHGAGVAGASNFATGGFVWGNFPNQQIVEKFSFASDNDSTTHTQLAQPQRDQTGQSGELFAYSLSGVFGGSPPNFLNTISKFSYTSDSFQFDIANCSVIQLASGTTSVFDNGYVIGGTNNGVKSAVIRINSHASDGDQTDISNLSITRSHFGGCGACN